MVLNIISIPVLAFDYFLNPVPVNLLIQKILNKCILLTQVIQSDLWIRPENIGSNTRLLRKPTCSVKKPIGSDLVYVGFPSSGIRTGLRREKIWSDPFGTDNRIISHPH